MNIDLITILTTIGTGIAVIGFIYGFMRNFKDDLNSHMDKIEKEWKEESRKMDQRVMETNRRMDGVYHILLKKLTINSNDG